MLRRQNRLLKAVVFDWAGTIIDYGSMAPLEVILKVFAANGVPITPAEAKGPMGKEKRDHVRTLFAQPRIREAFQAVHGREPGEQDVIDFHKQFEPQLQKILPGYVEPLPGAIEVLNKLRIMGLKIGSTTGYSREIMNVIGPLAAKKGFVPDCVVTPSEVSRARPYPWMIFKNAETLGINPIQSIVKVGDTVQDVMEGRNAGCWSVGVLKGSSQVGLTFEQQETIPPPELEKILSSVRAEFLEAGADFVLDSIDELPGLLTKINRKMGAGRHPGHLVHVPDGPYKLFTPGPLSTTKSVKLAMLGEFGARQPEFADCAARVRSRLVGLASSTPENYAAVLVPGSGTTGIEAVIGSTCGKGSKLLIIINGEYGRRTAEIARRLSIATLEIEFPEDETPDLAKIEELLSKNPDVTHSFFIHCENTSGILNPLTDAMKLLKSKGIVTIVDAMSSFGGIPLLVDKEQIDFLISCSCKCLQGVPGFSFVIAKLEELNKCKGNSPSLTLDLFDEWEYSKKSGGCFRFTPPTHAVLALDVALNELEAEGGIAKRHERFASNQKTLSEGLAALGIQAYDLKGHQSPFLTTFLSPKSPSYNFERLLIDLREKGFVIFPHKKAKVDSFRVGSIGHLKTRDIKDFLACFKDVKHW